MLSLSDVRNMQIKRLRVPLATVVSQHVDATGIHSCPIDRTIFERRPVHKSNRSGILLLMVTFPGTLPWRFLGSVPGNKGALHHTGAASAAAARHSAASGEGTSHVIQGRRGHRREPHSVHPLPGPRPFPLCTRSSLPPRSRLPALHFIPFTPCTHGSPLPLCVLGPPC